MARALALLGVVWGLLEVPLYSQPRSDALHTFFAAEVRNVQDMQYVGSIAVGTQNFTVIVDTGSAWLWVPAASCVPSCQNAKNFFVPSVSLTYHSLGLRIDLQYGRGKASGVLSSDQMSLAGARVQDHAFLLVDRNSEMENLQADGLLGMGFSALSKGFPPLVQRMKTLGVIPEAVFSLFLTQSGRSSMLTLGGYDLQKYASGALTFLAVNASAGHWTVPLDSVSVGSNVLSPVVHSAIIDSGTSFIHGPDEVVRALLQLVAEAGFCEHFQGMIVCSCAWYFPVHMYPKLKFVLAGQEFEVGPETYFLQEGSQCLAMIGGLGSSTYWILGDVFLREYYSVFDFDRARVGFARSVRQQAVSSLVCIVAGLVCVLLGGCCIRRRCGKQFEPEREPLLACAPEYCS